MKEKSFNMSLYMIFPLLTDAKKDAYYYFKGEIDSLLNGYSNWIERPQLDRNLIVSFDSEKMNCYKIKNLTSLDSFKGIKDVRQNKLYRTLYMFDIPEDMHEYYSMIKSGNYFELPMWLKVKILTFWRLGFDSALYDELFVRSISPIDINAEDFGEIDNVSFQYIEEEI